MEASLPLWIKQPTGCGDRVNPSTFLDAGELEWVYTPRTVLNTTKFVKGFGILSMS
jgi:hypothetical protein